MYSNIYSYWEGNKPDYINLCEESLIKNTKGLNLFIFDKTDKYNELPINLKVDYFKANLIYQHGGFWIDADMLVMKPLKTLFKLLNNHEFVGIPGFFGARPGAKILKRWINSMDLILKQEKIEFSDLIQPLLKDSEYKEFEVLTREMICPIYHTGDEFWNFFEDKPLEEFITDNTYIVTLYNSAFSNEFKKMKRGELLNKKWLISKMFRKAICE